MCASHEFTKAAFSSSLNLLWSECLFEGYVQCWSSRGAQGWVQTPHLCRNSLGREEKIKYCFLSWTCRDAQIRYADSVEWRRSWPSSCSKLLHAEATPKAQFSICKFLLFFRKPCATCKTCGSVPDHGVSKTGENVKLWLGMNILARVFERWICGSCLCCKSSLETPCVHLLQNGRLHLRELNCAMAVFFPATSLPLYTWRTHNPW